MVEIKTEIRKWGNSFGVVIPKEVIKKRHLKPRQRVTLLLLEEGNVLKRTFGTAKDWKTPTKEILEKTDRELYDD